MKPSATIRAEVRKALDRRDRGGGLTQGTTSQEQLMEYPVEVVPTTPRRHITGTTALNIPATYWMGRRDWHKHSTWFSTRPERLNDRDLTTEEKHGRLLDRLGLWGLRDARKGLAELGHPGGKSRERIWAATHDRAVIEESWKLLTRRVRTGATHPAFDQYELQKLLGYPDQWIRLRWWGWRPPSRDDGSGTGAGGRVAQGVVAMGQRREQYPEIALTERSYRV